MRSASRAEDSCVACSYRVTYGWPDLFVGNFSPRQDHIPSPDRLYVNMGGLYFRAATEYGLDVQVTGARPPLLPVGMRAASYNWQSGVGVKAKGGPSRCLATL